MEKQEQALKELSKCKIHQEFSVLKTNLVPAHSRPTISAPVAQNKEETGRPYEEIEFEDKKVNGNVSPQARTNGEVLPTKIPPGECGCYLSLMACCR